MVLSMWPYKTKLDEEKSKKTDFPKIMHMKVKQVR
jgi:hypothetical protein